VKSFNSVVSAGQAPVDVELAGVSVTVGAIAGCKVSVAIDAAVGCKVSAGNDISVVCEHAESVMNNRIVPINFRIIFSDL
jgi:hypothetical protein